MYPSYLPFYCNFQEKQFLKEILEPCQTSSMDFLCAKAPSQMLDWVLNAPLMMTVARY